MMILATLTPRGHDLPTILVQRHQPLAGDASVEDLEKAGIWKRTLRTGDLLLEQLPAGLQASGGCASARCRFLGLQRIASHRRSPPG
ncbi:MAG: hypothetical protein U0792_01830 [Gemmataceae bacterium]